MAALIVLSRKRRIILTLYGIALAYSFVWIPWKVPVSRQGNRFERCGYGWVWSGPERSKVITYNPPKKVEGGYDLISEEDLNGPPLTALPDTMRIVLRCLTATAVCLGLFFGVTVFERVS